MVTVENSSSLLDINRPYTDAEKQQLRLLDIYTVAAMYYFLLDKLTHFDQLSNEQDRVVLQGQLKDVEAVYIQFGFKPEANE